jgi:hypothetical protein
MSWNYEGNAKQCLKEAEELCYAYFSPELDNFTGEKVTVEDILYKVLFEIDLLDDPHESLKEHSEGSEYKWNTNRNKAWRKKAVNFLNKWSKDVNEENRKMYSEFK